MEAWKAVVGWEGHYEVSDEGRVRSVGRKRGRREGKLIRLRPHGEGYCFVRLKLNGRSFHPYVHRLVAMAFIPEVGGSHIVNHINEIRHDNRVNNLEWVTNAGNIRKSRRATLTPAWVEAIQKHQQLGIVADAELACLAAVTVRTIGSIRYGERWTAQ